MEISDERVTESDIGVKDVIEMGSVMVCEVVCVWSLRGDLDA